MELKKFAALYVGILGLGLIVLGFKDMIFMLGAESQVAKVAFHVPKGKETFHKMSGAYEEETLSPAITYAVDGTKITNIPEYTCTDGCQKVGSDVTVFYRKEKPQEAIIMSFGGFWKYKVYFLIVMAVLLLSALPYVFYTPKKQP